MKISKELLKKIIKEELEAQAFGKETASRTDISKDLKQRSRDVISQKGIDNRERGMIKRIETNLAKLADLTDIKSGAVYTVLKRLNSIIENQISKLENEGNKNEK